MIIEFKKTIAGNLPLTMHTRNNMHELTNQMQMRKFCQLQINSKHNRLNIAKHLKLLYLLY